MNKFGMLLLPALVAGCANSGDTTYYVEYTPSNESECTVSISENFIDAEVPADVDPSSDWTIERTGEYSPQSLFVQVIKGKGGEAFLIVGDAVYRGEAKGKELVFSWTFSEDSNDSVRHVSGYGYNSEVNSATTITWTLTKADGGYTGKVKVVTETEATYTENDEWSYDQTGVYYGEIGDQANRYLDGDADNLAEDQNCESATCSLTVSESCEGEDDVFLIKTKLGNESAYEGLENAGMPGGAN